MPSMRNEARGVAGFAGTSNAITANDAASISFRGHLPATRKLPLDNFRFADNPPKITSDLSSRRLNLVEMRSITTVRRNGRSPYQPSAPTEPEAEECGRNGKCHEHKEQAAASRNTQNRATDAKCFQPEIPFTLPPKIPYQKMSSRHSDYSGDEKSLSAAINQGDQKRHWRTPAKRKIDDQFIDWDTSLRWLR